MMSGDIDLVQEDKSSLQICCNVEDTPSANARSTEGKECLAEASSTVHLSKRKLKKLMKREAWLIQKTERRIFQKEKRKQKRREKLERGDDLGPSKRQLKQNTMKNSQCLIKVAIDSSFDDLMAEKDINKFGQQIQYCYSKNRRSKQPMQLYLTSLGSKTRERLDRFGDYHSWDINLYQKSYLDIFTKDSIVYLTSDSSNVLQTLMPDKVYIIGGLVDHNHHKGLCFDLAMKHGVSHARLPIGEYMQLSSRKVLTVNHVFEILLHFTESNSWSDSFFSVIPKRKQTDCKIKDELQNVSKKNIEHADDICPSDCLSSRTKSDLSENDLEDAENDCSDLLC